MSFVEKVAHNTIFQLVARIFSSGSSFLITILVARHFGIASYGDFAKVTAYVSLFYLFADFGLNAMFLQKEENKLKFKDLFYTRIILAIILILGVNVLAWFLPYNPITHIGFSPEVRNGITIFSFTLITEALTYTALALFQRELSYEYFMMATIIGSFTTLLFVFFATLFPYSIMFVLLAYVLGGIIKCTVALFFTKENMFPFQLDTDFIKKLTLDTLPITLMLICNLIYFRIDMIILSSLKPSTDVALYDMSYKFFDFFIALPLFLSNALYPSLLKQKDTGELEKHIHKYIGIFALLSLVIMIPVLVFAPLVGLIKQEFLGAAVPLRLLSLSLPIFFVTSILQWVLVAKKRQVFLAGVYLAAAILNIILNLIFIPRASYIASAIITGISEAIVLAALFVKIKTIIK